ncbi:MAG: 3-methyl-2-oxobutanoate dehydrogenase subunit beta [Candidatus Odinarchaeum yellowstonii]|uniref:3-methyl-2-oxobutanoate dehydrogenase subunit beta n=1 Tax=Odinarchaeota yellowstonii (strain LCB_4) TaxID=1841599 RepID=A0AAF0D3Y0_ODILC|nr:MAG: 3-methyl-2-oxobutanoate dehydrogenase subunit beta [Candidatus Odinarchaeum yellowstonii]
MNKILEISLEELLLPGHAACAGCGAALALRHVLKALGKNTIIVIPAGCSSIIQGVYPKSALNIPVLNCAFDSAAAYASGVVEGLKAKNKSENINVVVWAGDGATFDIGLQSLSGAAERDTDMIYFCYDNEAYMNTGIQTSSATPFGALTTTTPIIGKRERKKDILSIILANEPSYLATGVSGYPIDLHNKVLKAKKYRGFRFIHILTPCPPGWRFDSKYTVTISKLAVDTGMWPLFEVIESKFNLTGPSLKLLNPKNRKSVEAYLALQGRFSKLTKEEVNCIQKFIDTRWEYLKYLTNFKERRFL